MVRPAGTRNDGCRVGQPLHSVRDDLTAAFDQAVRVHDERVAAVQHDLVAGSERTAESCRDEQGPLHGAEGRAAVGAYHQRGRMTGVAQDHPSGRGRDHPDDGGDHPVLDECVEEVIQRREHLRRRQARDRVGADRTAHLAHEGSRRSALAHDITHTEENGVVAELEDVVPIAPGVGPGNPRPVLGIEQEALDVGQGVRQNRTLQHVRHNVLSLEPRGVGQGDPGSACHLRGQRDVVRLEGPARPVHEGHHPDDLAIGGQRHRQGGGDARRVVTVPAVVKRGQLCPTRSEGNGRRGIGCERKNLAPVPRRAATLCGGRHGLAYIESDEPALSGHLDRAGVGQAALNQAHGSTDHGRGLEARAQQPGHL